MTGTLFTLVARRLLVQVLPRRARNLRAGSSLSSVTIVPSIRLISGMARSLRATWPRVEALG